MTRLLRNRTMRSIRRFPLVVALLTVAACKTLDVADLNYPSVDQLGPGASVAAITTAVQGRSEEHTSELQSRLHLVCRLLLEKKKKQKTLNARLVHTNRSAHGGTTH